MARLAAKKPTLTAEARSTLPGSFVELSAGVTHYELRGAADAELVVLIHGNAAPMISWDHTVGPLCDAGFRVLRYDVFGHGYSDRPKLARYDRSFYNVQLTELLSRLDVPSPVSIVGTSQGGSNAVCFAAANPGAVRKLALLAPLVDVLPGSTGIMYKLLLRPGIGEFLLRLVNDQKLADISDAVVSPATKAALQPGVAEQYTYDGKRAAILANLRGDGLSDATSCYRQVGNQGIPLLATCGTRDRKIPRDSMNRLRDLVPGIEYHEIEGAGHLAHYEFPDLVNPLLIRFLSA